MYREFNPDDDPIQKRLKEVWQGEHPYDELMSPPVPVDYSEMRHRGKDYVDEWRLKRDHTMKREKFALVQLTYRQEVAKREQFRREDKERVRQAKEKERAAAAERERVQQAQRKARAAQIAQTRPQFRKIERVEPVQGNCTLAGRLPTLICKGVRTLCDIFGLNDPALNCLLVPKVEPAAANSTFVPKINKPTDSNESTLLSLDDSQLPTFRPWNCQKSVRHDNLNQSGLQATTTAYDFGAYCVPDEPHLRYSPYPTPSTFPGTDDESVRLRKAALYGEASGILRRHDDYDAEKAAADAAKPRILQDYKWDAYPCWYHEVEQTINRAEFIKKRPRPTHVNPDSELPKNVIFYPNGSVGYANESAETEENTKPRRKCGNWVPLDEKTRAALMRPGPPETMNENWSEPDEEGLTMHERLRIYKERVAELRVLKPIIDDYNRRAKEWQSHMMNHFPAEFAKFKQFEAQFNRQQHEYCKRTNDARLGWMAEAYRENRKRQDRFAKFLKQEAPWAIGLPTTLQRAYLKQEFRSRRDSASCPTQIRTVFGC